MPVMVRPGDVEVAGVGRVLATLGLGSCVAVALFDREAEVGGLCHAMLPSPPSGRPGGRPGRYVSLAIPRLLDLARDAGAESNRLVAWIVGGATMFPGLTSDGEGIGSRNVRAARAELESVGVRVVGEDVGGSHGRSVYLDLEAGALRVRAVSREDLVL